MWITPLFWTGAACVSGRILLKERRVVLFTRDLKYKALPTLPLTGSQDSQTPLKNLYSISIKTENVGEGSVGEGPIGFCLVTSVPQVETGLHPIWAGSSQRSSLPIPWKIWGRMKQDWRLKLSFSAEFTMNLYPKYYSLSLYIYLLIYVVGCIGT